MSGLQIHHYGSRHFALYDGGELVCVTVYRKGAAEVKRRLEAKAIEGTTFNLLAGFNPMCTDIQEACRLTQEGTRKALEAAGLIAMAA